MESAVLENAESAILARIIAAGQARAVARSRSRDPELELQSGRSRPHEYAGRQGSHEGGSHRPKPKSWMHTNGSAVFWVW
jgi:hypothetical protein